MSNSAPVVNSLCGAAFIVFLASCSPHETAETEVRQPNEADVLQARAASKMLGGELKGALVPAMKSGGPVEAVQVCYHSAPVIADNVSEAQSITVGRTALRVRNPDNAPDAWETAQLLAFTDALDNGADPATLEHAELLKVNGVETFRYMKPIMLDGVCATCHGEAIAPALLDEIKQSYPTDEATGFKPGELRGAFTISKVLSE